MNIDITLILNSVIALAAAIVSTVIIPWIRSKTTTQQREALMAWVKIAVEAAEQIFSGEGRGDEKKKYVAAFLEEKGFKIDGRSVDAAIEAAVRQINSEGISLS